MVSAPQSRTSTPLPKRMHLDHPFEHSNSLLEILPNRIDVQEELRLYDELCVGEEMSSPTSPYARSPSPPVAPSVFSNDIWLADSLGESQAFARNVKVGGWTSVGDKRGGAYVVYDCAVYTKEGTVIHVHKRYTAFAELNSKLHATLPPSQQCLVPPLPPKSPLAKFNPRFLERRRRRLQHWLSSVLLHPDIGGCQALRDWVME